MEWCQCGHDRQRKDCPPGTPREAGRPAQWGCGPRPAAITLPHFTALLAPFQRAGHRTLIPRSMSFTATSSPVCLSRACLTTPNWPWPTCLSCTQAAHTQCAGRWEEGRSVIPTIS